MRPWRHLFLLACLYVVQGLPSGFQASALAPYLRSEGVSLSAIGFAGALAAPWMLKALWAPLVDRWGSARFGRRRSWIVPMQALLAGACALAARFPPERGIAPVLALIFVMNLFAATMDVAVDGLAVDVLSERELGAGNAVQVVGFKVGMLIGGGLLLWASQWIGWIGHFLAMGGLALGAMLVTLAVREPARSGERAGEVTSEVAHTTVRDVLRILGRAFRAEGAGWVLLAIATYKLGESVIDPMFSPFLIDEGFERETIGLWVGTYGMAASITGSIAGGVLASRLPLPRALLVCGILRAIPLAAELALAALGIPGAGAVIAATVAEHFFGGMLTTAMFAFMMSRVDRRIGASHFTLLATIEVLGKSPLSLASGVLAQHLGYPATFAIGVTLSLAWAALIARAPLAPPTATRPE